MPILNLKQEISDRPCSLLPGWYLTKFNGACLTHHGAAFVFSCRHESLADDRRRPAAGGMGYCSCFDAASGKRIRR